MGPVQHAAVSAAIGATLAYTTGSIEAGAVAFAVGTFIDLDHALDYYLARGLRIEMRLVRSGEYFRQTGRAFVVLHSYEAIVVACLLVASRFGWLLGLAVALGALSHTFCDVVYYGFSPRCYSILHRLAHGFSLSAFKRKPPELKGEARVS